MKKFSLQEYLTNPSQKIVTRDGKPVRILCTDAKTERPIVGLVTYDDTELIYNFMGDGKWSDRDEEDNFDLFFDTKKGEGWVNIYRIADTDELEASCIFSTKEEAEFYRGEEPKPNYVATTRIEWEE